MPLLDIATVQPSLRNNLYTSRSQILYHGTFIYGNEQRLASSWKYFRIPENAKIFSREHNEMWGRFMIKAVATFEPKYSILGNDGHNDYHNLHAGIDSRSSPVIEHQSLIEDSTEVNDREKLRRMRISQANKGNTPWNKGRKHSPETIQRIRERTRLAMQDPKVKMKLVNLGHAQSKETRIKIGVGVRIGWGRRREKQMLQETCHIEWQNLIAEASRRGFVGEEELHWDSYKILDEQLEQEWLESVELRKKMRRPKGSKRAPKSPEQRRKISEAIAAKWSDPVYRDRVYSGLSKYHGTPVGIKKKPRRRPTADKQPRKMRPSKKANDIENSAGNETSSQILRSRLKRSSVPLYKDPLASSKLEMIKTIRAQRAAAENKKTEAITRANLLIAEAEKAAKALEVAATRSPLAQASLIESRKLIAEAIQYMESIETGPVDSHGNGRCPPFSSTALVNLVEKETDAVEDLTRTDRSEVNGAHALASSESDITNFGFGKFTFHDLRDGKDEVGKGEILSIGKCDDGLLNGKEELYRSGSNNYGLAPIELEHLIKHLSFTKQRGQVEPNGSNRCENLLLNGAKSQSVKNESTLPSSIAITKKWVRGKLVEVAEGE